MGGELVSLNGQPMSEILEKMLTYIPSDGHIETSKYKRLERTEYFAQLYSLLYGNTTRFTLEYRSPLEKKVQEIQVEGLRAEPMNQVFRQRYPEAAEDLPPIQIEYRGDVAILIAVSGYQYPDRGIIPDYPFTPAIKDLIADKDTEMEYVIGLIQR